MLVYIKIKKIFSENKNQQQQQTITKQKINKNQQKCYCKFEAIFYYYL